MKKMNNRENYTDSEWEELASLLSDEKAGKSDLLDSFMTEDGSITANQWKELSNMNSEERIDVDKAWDKLNSRIGKELGQTDSSPVKMSYMRTNLLRVAAAALILIALGSTFIYLNSIDSFSRKMIVATTADQKNIEVLMPDGSKIYLNRNSELSYRSSFGKNKRDVKLTGEAFFDIAPDGSKPFTIDAGNALVKVVGTSFNVITDINESAVEVYVKTGKVMLSGNDGSQSLLLDPEYIGKIDSGSLEKTVNNNPNYLAWQTGLLVYNGQKLGVVFSDLKRVYNMDIVADDPSILDFTWTTDPIDNQPEETIIRLICISFNMSYSKDGSVYHLSRK